MGKLATSLGHRKLHYTIMKHIKHGQIACIPLDSQAEKDFIPSPAILWCQGLKLLFSQSILFPWAAVIHSQRSEWVLHGRHNNTERTTVLLHGISQNDVFNGVFSQLLVNQGWLMHGFAAVISWLLDFIGRNMSLGCKKRRSVMIFWAEYVSWWNEQNIVLWFK